MGRGPSQLGVGGSRERGRASVVSWGGRMFVGSRVHTRSSPDMSILSRSRYPTRTDTHSRRHTVCAHLPSLPQHASAPLIFTYLSPWSPPHPTPPETSALSLPCALLERDQATLFLLLASEQRPGQVSKTSTPPRVWLQSL